MCVNLAIDIVGDCGFDLQIIKSLFGAFVTPRYGLSTSNFFEPILDFLIVRWMKQMTFQSPHIKTLQNKCIGVYFNKYGSLIFFFSERKQGDPVAAQLDFYPGRRAMAIYRP